MVVDAASDSVHEHRVERRAGGYAMNVNLLGEGVLGDDEGAPTVRADLGPHR
ncbi:MAG: hypothetical protein Ct9H300mP12_08260 [Acidimicrobiales bacterium]|nr:MAG: hypothetical protein Ct9H300mP12_08260 [Acidimicrobiales bacterium]